MKKTKTCDISTLSDQLVQNLDRILLEPLPIPIRIQEINDRIHDDHDGSFAGKINVIMSDDGDMWIMTDKQEFIRFRMPMIGGGQSPRVYTALRILAYAIELDNKQFPQREM